MATAVPTAPAPAAESASVTETAPVVTGTDIAPAAKPESSLKPIPSRPRLPGVDPDIGATLPADTQTPSSAAGRDPATGRFTASSDPATPDGSVNTLEPSPTPAKPKFKMAGEEWDSQDAFEKNFKTLRGGFKPLQAVAKQLGGVDQVVPTLIKAAESSRAWEAEAKRLKAELDGKSQPAVVPAKANAAEAAPDSINEELYAEIRRLAIEKGEPWMAQEWLTAETNKIMEAKFQKMLDERFKPLVDEQEYQSAMEQTGELFGSLADLKQSDGSLAYPELHDPAQSYAVGQLWRNMGLPPEHAMTRTGAILSIALHRMVSAGLRGSQAAVPQAVASPTGSTPFVAAPTDTSAAASLTDGRPTVGLTTDASANLSPQAAAIIAGMRRAGTGQRAALGFEP